MLTASPVVVLGMFRSGTSAVAGALSSLGVYFGEESEFFRTDDFNASGYFELRELMELNRTCLASFAMTNIQARPLPAGWHNHPEAAFLLDGIEHILKKHFDGRDRWGWKEPQTAALLPLYKEVLDRQGCAGRYVICVRNPLDVLASQRELGTLPLIGARALGLWLHYTLSALSETTGESRSVILYEEFLQDPRLALTPTVEQIGLQPSDEEWKAASGTVRPSLSHSRLGLDGLSAYPELVTDTFDLCRELARNPVALNKGEFDARIRTLWSDWAQWNEMLRMTDMPYGILTVTWPAGQATLPFAPNGVWQSLTIRTPAPPDSPVRIHLYHLPSQVWIRKALWRQGTFEAPAELGPGPGGALEEHDGVRRIRIFGADHLRSRMPPGQGEWSLALEILLQCDGFVSSQIVRSLKDRLDMLRERMGGNR